MRLFSEKQCLTFLKFTFLNAGSRCNVLYHLLKRIGKEPNADLLPFMKGVSHQRTEEEIKFVVYHLG